MTGWKLITDKPEVQSYRVQNPTICDSNLLEARFSGSVAMFGNTEGRKVSLRLKYQYLLYVLDCIFTLFDDRPEPHCFAEGGVQRTWSGPTQFQSSELQPNERATVDSLTTALLTELPLLDARYFANPAHYRPHPGSNRAIGQRKV